MESGGSGALTLTCMVHSLGGSSTLGGHNFFVHLCCVHWQNDSFLKETGKCNWSVVLYLFQWY